VDIGPNPGGSVNMGNTQPTDGDTFLSMECGGGPGGAGEGFSLSFCPDVTLEVGTQYCISIDLITRASFGNNAGTSGLVVYGSSAICQTTQTLWTLPQATGSWQTYNFCFIATGNWSVISFRVLNPISGFSAIGLDNMSFTQAGEQVFSDCTTLDVDWLDVGVACTDGGRRISWSVSSVDDSLHFVVERSTDLMQWTVVGTFDLLSAGVDQQSFSILDLTMDHPVDEGLLFYRVGAMGLDGFLDYSAVAGSQCDLVIFPNPADTYITVRVVQPDALIRVVDATGRLVIVQRVDGYTSRISIAELASGYYAVQVVHSGLLLAHGVFVKM